MARTKGALNKRTLAAMSAASSGKFKEAADSTLRYLQGIVNDASKPEEVRMRAADILLPYQKPRLAAVEQTIVDPRDSQDPAALAQKLAAMFNEKPELFDQVVALRNAANQPAAPVSTEEKRVTH